MKAFPRNIWPRFQNHNLERLKDCIKLDVRLADVEVFSRNMYICERLKNRLIRHISACQLW